MREWRDAGGKTAMLMYSCIEGQENEMVGGEITVQKTSSERIEGSIYGIVIRTVQNNGLCC